MKRLLAGFLRRTSSGRPRPAGGDIAARYRAFKTLLGHNHAALQHLARLEQTYFTGKTFSLAAVRAEYVALVEAVYGMVHALEALTGCAQPALLAGAERIDGALVGLFTPQHCPLVSPPLAIPFADLLPEMKAVVGAKAANLAAIGNGLGLPVPDGFAVTAHGCQRFLDDNRLTAVIEKELARAAPESPRANEDVSRRLQGLIRSAPVPAALADAIRAGYEQLEARIGPAPRVAMRSSAVGEDTEPTFAGQYETVLNVTRDGLLAAYKEVLASKYAPQAISYRMQHGLDDRETPMCVAAVTMVDARASGVVYTRDPAQPAAPLLKVNSLWGLGEPLVDGSASPDVFLVDRDSGEIRERTIARKRRRLTAGEDGGTRFDEIPDREQSLPSLDDEAVATLARYGLLLERFFGGPQDIEWARAASGGIVLLQSRSLFLPDVHAEDQARREFPGHPVLLARGVMAAPGIAAGTVFVARTDDDLKAVPPDAILVVRTASPKYARVATRIRGLIADVGSVTSHMASVAREFGLPAIVDAGNATEVLRTGDPVTLAAGSATLYHGIVEELVQAARPARPLILDSPVHRRMRAILDLITPLSLTDPGAPSFAPEACRTFHDIIRYCHEHAVRAMFGLSAGAADRGAAVRLVSRLPLRLYLVDLGGGLHEGATVRDRVTAEQIACRPLAALWRGFTHPGVSWEGTMNTAAGTLAGSLAAPATAELGEQPGGDSYAVVSSDYLNFSARFAFHFSTIDALCGDNSAQNYVALQFSGGAGSYYGRSLRVQLMANILERLGFEVAVNGDLLTATFARGDRDSTVTRLDLLGRLLASSRLLDMTLSDQEELAVLAGEFFKGNYDFLAKDRGGELAALYVQGGRWARVVEDGHACCVQDGSRFRRPLTARLAGALARVVGKPYYEFLDSIEVNYHFPLAIVRNAELAEGTVSVRVRPVAGAFDQAGGIAFGIRDRNNYFVLRSNALEGNVALFEFRNGRRHERAAVEREIRTGAWHRLQVTIAGGRVDGAVDGEPLISVDAGKSLAGFVGLWTKADSTIWFDRLVIEDGGVRRDIPF